MEPHLAVVHTGDGEGVPNVEGRHRLDSDREGGSIFV